MALPSPPPSKQCWDEETLSGQAKVYRAADKLQHCLGAGGKKGRSCYMSQDFCPPLYVIVNVKHLFSQNKINIWCIKISAKSTTNLASDFLRSAYM